MFLGIDHIVIAVRDLEAATKNYEQLGFTVVPGGRHPVGTYNSLIAFADGSYIELISFYRDNPDHRWWDALQKGGGLVDYCMQTDDLAGDTAKLRAAGVKIDDPVPWSRTRPDGYQLRWLLSLARGEHRGVAPFLIQDETPREQRIPREKIHKNGVTGIGTVTVAADDLLSVRHWYRSVLGYDGTEIKRDDLRARGIRFEIGSHSCYFAQPTDNKSPLVECLKRRGASPYAATLRSNSPNPSVLDTTLTQGARLFYSNE